MMVNTNITIEKKLLKEGYLRKFNEIYPDSFLIYLLLCAFSFDDRSATVSLKTLIKASGYSLNKVVNTITALEKKGIIKRANRIRGEVKTYFLRK